jgi:hypothetical protein
MTNLAEGIFRSFGGLVVLGGVCLALGPIMLGTEQFADAGSDFVEEIRNTTQNERFGLLFSGIIVAALGYSMASDQLGLFRKQEAK